ncbi:hypothetical protein [Mycetocola manganoxydans]|uniref:hypothetical protein n=1 Tax=Mycetocola manganoxydans TaxID=699879 RepID=UPI0019C321DC|nr:hypothetical protein [Mycetocola manganoxydans]GHD50895.1 hypothetical protein GCM10008097_25370 [Mycetocola manganoxydans]
MPERTGLGWTQNGADVPIKADSPDDDPRWSRLAYIALRPEKVETFTFVVNTTKPVLDAARRLAELARNDSELRASLPAIVTAQIGVFGAPVRGAFGQIV